MDYLTLTSASQPSYTITVAAMSDESLKLRARLEALPQELYDRIFDLTFTANPGLRDLGWIVSHDDAVTFKRLRSGSPSGASDTRYLSQMDLASRHRSPTHTTTPHSSPAAFALLVLGSAPFQNPIGIWSGVSHIETRVWRILMMRTRTRTRRSIGLLVEALHRGPILMGSKV